MTTFVFLAGHVIAQFFVIGYCDQRQFNFFRTSAYQLIFAFFFLISETTTELVAQSIFAQ